MAEVTIFTLGKAYATECTPSWAARMETNKMLSSGTSWSFRERERERVSDSLMKPSLGNFVI